MEKENVSKLRDWQQAPHPQHSMHFEITVAPEELSSIRKTLMSSRFEKRQVQVDTGVILAAQNFKTSFLFNLYRDE